MQYGRLPGLHRESDFEAAMLACSATLREGLDSERCRDLHDLKHEHFSVASDIGRAFQCCTYPHAVHTWPYGYLG